MVDEKVTYPRLRRGYRTICVRWSRRSPVCTWYRSGTRSVRPCRRAPKASSVVFVRARCAAPPAKISTRLVPVAKTLKSSGTTCMASLFNCAFLRTDSISPTAKPMSRFMRRMGISTMNSPRMKKAGIGKGRNILSSSVVR